MRKMAASPKFFAKTCQDLLERMINTVPKGVKLTEIVEPIRIKPAMDDIVLMPETKTMSILGTVRVSLHRQLMRSPMGLGAKHIVAIRSSKTAQPVPAEPSRPFSTPGVRPRVWMVAKPSRRQRTGATSGSRTRATPSLRITPSTSPFPCSHRSGYRESATLRKRAWSPGHDRKHPRPIACRHGSVFEFAADNLPPH